MIYSDHAPLDHVAGKGVHVLMADPSNPVNAPIGIWTIALNGLDLY